ncbi:NADH dehydrogenase [Pseudomonas aeruginosa]|nr:NADH dehydrogenase [Pseudomonas aeruginosa]
MELVPERDIDYDTLVIAVGSTTNDFGTEGAAQHCIFLDTRAQAERFHRQLLGQYLRAHTGHDADNNAGEHSHHRRRRHRRRTGRRTAPCGADAGRLRLDRIRPEDLHISLIEAGPRVLPALPERIGPAGPPDPDQAWACG